MKKIVLTMTLIAGVVAGAMTLSAFTKEEPKNDNNTIVATEEMAGGCSFEVTDVSPSISGTQVTLKVTVCPTFTPSENASYTVTVKPNGSLRNILDSQSKSLRFSYSSKRWSSTGGNRCGYVEFYCDVHDNTYNQCNTQSFSASCFKN